MAATYVTRFAFSHETAALLHGWSVWLLVAELDGAVKYAGDERDPARAARIVAEEKEREDLIRRVAAPTVRFERFVTADLLDLRSVGRRLRNACLGGGGRLGGGGGGRVRSWMC